MDRRSFISNLSLVSGGLALAGNSLACRADALVRTSNLSEYIAVGFRKLSPVAAQNTGEVLLALPDGFQYNVIGKKGDPMADGRPTPTLHDGMHTFKVRNELRIVRNHEVINLNLPKL